MFEEYENIKVPMHFIELTADGAPLAILIDRFEEDLRGRSEEEIKKIKERFTEFTDLDLSVMIIVRKMSRSHSLVTNLLDKVKEFEALIPKDRMISIFDWIENRKHYDEWEVKRASAQKNTHYYRYMEYLHQNVKPGSFILRRDGDKSLIAPVL